MLRLRRTSVQFTPRPVQDAAARGKVRVLTRLGAFVRRDAIESMLGHRPPPKFGVHSKVTNRAGSSQPGQPPTPHKGEVVRRIQFAVTASTGEMVCGPTTFGTLAGARALEMGLAAPITSHGRRVTGHFRKFPFMLPALQKNLPKVPAMLPGSIRK